ncbi:MAG TPA: hypothetical protein DCZ94_18505 [Lentisphaeria bacterium]|nr:MAG: hypothetical protein A2X48_24065 [Lentisphaerae bacterium GWF2_49_21]HBC88938.1 hypothetical protein [Lentisphaeria bacterium]
MRKLVYFILGLIFIPIIVLIIFIVIPLFLLFLLFLRMFASRRRRTAPRNPPPRNQQEVRPSDDIYDIDCEVVDEKDSKK